MMGAVGTPPTVGEYAEWNLAALSRVRISRRTLVVGAGAAAAAAAFPLARHAFTAGGGVPGPTRTAITGRHLAWVADGGGDPGTALRVTAQLLPPGGTLPAGLRAVVDLGAAAGSYGTSVPAEIVHLTGLYAIPGGPAGSQFYLKAELTGLRPGTTHHYRFRLSDGTTTGDASFVTAPARGTPAAPFTFTAFADVGTSTPPTDPRYAWAGDPSSVRKNGGTWPAGRFDNGYASDDPIAGAHGRDPRPAATQIALMATQRPRFTLLAGDICYADPSGTGLPADDRTPPAAGTNAYDPYVWDVFLTRIDRQAAYTPWMFTTGNHDMEALYGGHGYAGHAARLDLPRNGPAGCPSVYSFRYANVGVVSLDANELSAEIRANRGYSGGAQQRWLEQTLRALRGDPAIDFVVAFFHHCAYSTTREHASDGGVRDAVDALFSRYQVDLAIQGHNHVMERTDPIRDGRPTRSAPDGATVDPVRDGVTYLCIGSGGRARYSFPPGAGQRYRGAGGAADPVESYVWAPDGSKQPERVGWSRVRYDGYAFLAVDVVPARAGLPTTMTLRTLADALPGQSGPYTEIDRVTLRRIAG
jgi:hypothetical protein